MDNLKVWVSLNTISSQEPLSNFVRSLTSPRFLRVRVHHSRSIRPAKRYYMSYRWNEILLRSIQCRVPSPISRWSLLVVARTSSKSSSSLAAQAGCCHHRVHNITNAAILDRYYEIHQRKFDYPRTGDLFLRPDLQ